MSLPSAAALDAADPLAGFAAEFAKAPGEVYLDGNSLGLLCRSAEASLQTAVGMWRDLAIRGWTDGPDPWFELSRKAAGLLAPLLGADPADVMVGQTTTANLHQLLATFYDPASDRPDVLIDAGAFPTDRYAVESHLRLRGRDPAKHVVVAEPGPDGLLDEDDLLARIGYCQQLAVLPSVVYTTGQFLGMPYITSLARRRGVRILWDCSHSAGVVPHRFWHDEIDFAFGGTYKWLNGGPGSVGWLYVREKHRPAPPGMAGWFGCDPARQFEMAAEFHPAADAGRYLMGTPHVLSLAPVVGALEVFRRADIVAVGEKSLRQTAFLREHAEARLARFGVRVVTPRADACRGGHLTLAHPDAGKLSRALRLRKVVPDFRPPDLLRLAPAPLYTSFAECERAIDVLENVLSTNAHLALPDRDAAVT